MLAAEQAAIDAGTPVGVLMERAGAALAEAAGIYAHLYLDDAEAPSRLD